MLVLIIFLILIDVLLKIIYLCVTFDVAELALPSQPPPPRRVVPHCSNRIAGSGLTGYIHIVIIAYGFFTNFIDHSNIRCFIYSYILIVIDFFTFYVAVGLFQGTNGCSPRVF